MSDIDEAVKNYNTPPDSSTFFLLGPGIASWQHLRHVAVVESHSVAQTCAVADAEVGCWVDAVASFVEGDELQGLDHLDTEAILGFNVVVERLDVLVELRLRRHAFRYLAADKFHG